MTRKSFLFLIIFIAWPILPSIANDSLPIEVFLGHWKGDQVSSDMENLSPEALDMRVRSEKNGFRISWHDLGKNNPAADGIDARFLSTGRAGVYEFAPKPGSLLERMFASPSSGNPLEGETLLWARIDDLTLAVYSMEVKANGGFWLDRYSWTRTEQGLRLKYSRRTEDLDTETMIEGDLIAGEG